MANDGATAADSQRARGLSAQTERSFSEPAAAVPSGGAACWPARPGSRRVAPL